MNIEETCCFTGHRPEKLKSGEAEIRNALKEKITEAVSKGFKTFISGMAPGVDIWAAEEVLELKKTNGEIKLICAVPFPGVHKNRTKEERERFETIISAADGVEYICPGYTRWCFQARDKWMVDNAALIIAVYGGIPGGTKITLDLAKKKNREIMMIEDKGKEDV